jgi:hypothetical protein
MSPRLAALACLLAAGACGDDSAAGSPDAVDAADARQARDGRYDSPPIDAHGPDGPPWSGTITIDGLDTDWRPGAEQLETTSSAHFINLTWDATNLYVGLAGDLSVDPAGSWLAVCFDTNPDMGTDRTEAFGTQQASFPNGLRPEMCYRRTLDGATSQLRMWNGGAWVTASDVTNTAQSATLIEASITRASIGATTTLGLTALVFDTTGPRRAYAGLYPGSFSNDSNDALVGIAYYLGTDFISEAPPNDPELRRP